MLGTEGKLLVHSFEYMSTSSFFPVLLTSTFSPFADLLFASRDSAPGLLSVLDLGAPTCFTEAAGIGGCPLLGGIGGFEDEFRRWCECVVKVAVITVAWPGAAGRSGGRVALGQLRATRRSEELNIRWQTRAMP